MNKIKIGWGEESIIPEGRKVDLVGQFYERISDKVETPIAVNALAIECGNDAVIFCSCDLVSTSHSLLEDVRAALPESFPKDKLIINAIHTHSSIGYSKRSDMFSNALYGLKAFLPEEYIYKPLVSDDSPEVIRGDAVFIVERHGEDALLDFGCSEEQDVEAVLVLPIEVSREYIVPVIRREGTEKEPGREGKDDQEQYVCDNTLRNNLHGFYSSSRSTRDASL